MSYQNISAGITAADVAEIKKALVTINAKLPFLITLTADERKNLFKMGAKSLEFVQDCRSVAANYPDVLPSAFEVNEFAKDADLVRTLSEIKILMEGVCEKVNDTTLAVGSEAMRSSLEVYEYVKTASKRRPGLKSVSAQLSQRFKEQGKRPQVAKQVK